MAAKGDGVVGIAACNAPFGRKQNKIFHWRSYSVRPPTPTAKCSMHADTLSHVDSGNARGNMYDLIVTHHWLSPLTLALELALTIDTCIRTHHSHSPSTLALSLTIGYYNWRSHSNWPSPLTLAWTLTIDTRIDTHHWHSPSTLALFMFGSMTQQ